MPRVPRSRLGEGVYHVLNRGINRSIVFEDEEDKGAFLGLLVEYRKRFPLRVLHWVIMGNHFHLVLEILKAQDLTGFMSARNSSNCPGSIPGPARAYTQPGNKMG